MNPTARPKRVLTALIVALAATGAGCGSSGDAAQGGLVDSPETTTAPTTVPTTAVQSVMDDSPVSFIANVAPLTPGTTYVTDTDVPFSFSVAESEADWRGVFAEDWSVSMVYGNVVGGEVVGPQVSLGVAEPGATIESVVAAMVASAESLNFESSEGLFGGRAATILDGSLEDDVIPRPRRIFTGEDSSIEVIFETGRSYRSHVFEEDGRVFIFTVEALAEMPVVLAEAAPIFESLQIGGAE